MKRSSLVAATGIAAGLVLASAAVLESCVLPDFYVGELPDSGVDAGKEAGPPPPCGATYPDPPQAEDVGGDGSYVVAIRTVDLGEGSNMPPGYDLDGQCTCVQEAGATCVGTMLQCDAPNGVDNTMAKLINLVSSLAGVGSFGSAAFSAQAYEGKWGAIIKIDRYNGLSDDPSVDVAMLVSPGFGSDPDAGAHWDGNDEWPITSDSLDPDAGTPLFQSKGAYVANHVLVAALPTTALAISGSNERITINITGGVLTGRLQQFGNVYRIVDGVLAGRWRESDVFKALSSYRDSDGKPFCTDLPLFYKNAKGIVCSSRDILADPTGAKSLPCDSLSLGMGFTAEPAKIGPTKAPTASTPGCPPQFDPANDFCPKLPP